MLRARIVVALIGVPVGIAIVVMGGKVFLTAMIILCLLGLHEFYGLVRPYRPNLLVGYIAALAALAGAFFGGLGGLTGGIAILLLFLFLWAMGGRLGEHLVGRMSVTTLGVLWVAFGFAHLILLRGLEHGLALTVLAMGSAWMGDTFAYFFGRWLGRHRIAPRISPKKTVEGAVAGLIGAVFFAMGVKIYADWLPAREAAVLGLLAGIVGQWGDLFESAVKRDLRVKDSGRMLPGHGGILDRFDSLLFAGVAAYWGAVLLLENVVGGFPR